MESLSCLHTDCYSVPRFILRVDDYGKDTDPMLMEAIYGDVMDRGYKPCFGVIPEGVDKRDASMKWLRRQIDKGRADAFLHGYRHSQYEFVCGREEASRMLRDGIHRYADALNSVPFAFAAPWENISQDALQAVYDEDLDYSAFPVKVFREKSIFIDPYLPLQQKRNFFIPRVFPALPQGYNSLHRYIRYIAKERKLLQVLTHSHHYDPKHTDRADHNLNLLHHAVRYIQHRGYQTQTFTNYLGARPHQP